MTDFRIHRPPVALLLAGALLLTAPALAGCSVPIPNIGGGSGAEEPAVLPGMSIPADFPVDVPLVDGEVRLGTKPTDTSWMVSLVVADEGALDEADRLLEDAGFTEKSDGSHMWEKDDNTVIISISGTDAGFVLNYIVSVE